MLDHKSITDKIILQMEAAGARWPIPCHTDGNTNYIPFNAATKKPFRDVNILILWGSAARNNYEHGIWAAHAQWEAMGYKVHGKGLKPEKAVFWRTGSEAYFAEPRYLLNCAQIEGYVVPERTVSPEKDRLTAAAKYFVNIGADIRYDDGRTGFHNKGNFIQIPNIEHFSTSAEYYSNLSSLHIRWTAHRKQMKRDFRKHYGSNGHVFERLVSQIGGAFLAAHLGIELAPMRDHEKYLPMWLTMMHDDNEIIFKAARHAQNAFDWLNMKAQATK
jgi:antirestriction protein ArdC